MKKTIYLIMTAALLAAGTTLTSCSDFWEAENKSAGGQTADDRFGADATSYLTATYSSLKNIVYNVGLYQQGTDLFVNTRGKAQGSYNEYSLTPEDNGVKSLYSNLYKTVNYANGVINYAGEDSPLAHEARFLRGYAYYVLTQQFGGVPYITTYINDASREYPRTSLEEVYTNLIEDLEDLYANSTLADQSHEGRASKQAVAALLAKLYLSAGWDLDTQYTDVAKGTYAVNGTTNFTKAAQWAETAIHNVNLTMSFEDKWSAANEGNAEEIFSVQYERAGFPGNVTSGGHSQQNNYGGYYGECLSTCMKNVGSENAQSEKAMYLFEKGDNRYEATYMTTMYNASDKSNWGTEGYYAYYKASNRDNLPIYLRFFPWYVTEAEAEAEFATHSAQYYKGSGINRDVIATILTLPNVVKYTFNEDGTYVKTTQSIADYNAGTNNCACVKKFDDPDCEQVTGNNSYRDIVIFHVSDMYLIAAEAYLMAGQTSQALAKFNAVRNRAGLPSLSAFSAYEYQYSTTTAFLPLTDLDVILDERARELYAEGYRWMDLRRTKQLVRYNVEFNIYVPNARAMMDVTGTDYKLYRPIPSDEIEMNTAMDKEDQNPGY